MPRLRATLRAHSPVVGLALTWLAAIAPAACDGGPRAVDAQSPPNAISAELSVRFEIAPDKPPTVSALGFRAETAGSDEVDVLGLVDPLAAAAPDQGCVLRDVDTVTSALAARGSSIDLAELGGVGVGLGPGEPLLRPFPRVFPDFAGVVGGVVAESGPQPVAVVPERVSVLGAESELPLADIAVPALPRLTAINGAAPAAGVRVDATEGLSLSLAGAAGTLVEIRPFGATVAVACAVPGNASTESVVAVPRALLAHLRGRAVGDVAASIEVARRVRERAPLGSPSTRITLEVRAAEVVELRL